MEIHNIDPVWNENSKILVLGSFPSVKSRSEQFFYAHPQNRFWRVVAAVTGTPLAKSVDEKKNMLLNCRIALWDVIKSCDITGSADSSIKNAVPNDLNSILSNSSVDKIFTNGAAADKLYKKYCEKETGITAIRLPSTSPANAAFSLGHLTQEWGIIAEYI
ncbi:MULTISPECIES: DNA-deoxyinosine glycosylase [unclassified Ruminococcus]|uniref:DNA-deoxyinosine glycosylase n=1 Tax=unclassified Ruminococcus TaxID=2608920 RepID=UPI00210EE38C|nr:MULTISPECIES: DNA-deoxyinosine glycosylase [unclassified Ruminococcus]